MERPEGPTTLEEIIEAAAIENRQLIEELLAVTRLSLLDPSPSTIYVSPQIELLTGYPARDWFDDPDFSLKLIHHDDRERMAEAYAVHASVGQPMDEEYRVVTRERSIVWIREVSRTIVNDDGRPVASQGILFDVTDRKDLQRELDDSVALRQALPARLVSAQDRDCAEIHDEAIQILSEASRRLDVLTNSLTEPRHVVEVTDVAEMVEGATRRLERLTLDMSWAFPDTGGLASRIRLLLDEIVGGPVGLATHLDDRLIEEPTPEVRTLVCLIVKEALSNVRKHANARSVVIAAETLEGGVLVTIEDNGTGFDPVSLSDVSTEHLGLRVMRERALVSGGWLRTNSSIGQGTTIRFWIPSSPE